MFIDYPKKTDVVEEYDIYLPTVGPIYTEDQLHLLIFKKEHIYYDEIKATQQDFYEIKRCYTATDGITKKGYVQGIANFVSKALNKKIPTEIDDNISKIK